MTLTAKKNTVFTGKKMIVCLVAWFVVCSILYVFIQVWEGNRNKALVKIGVSISKDISSQSGLPLLEKNINLLTRIIADVTQRPEVVFASIIDHKNKIIAYSDQKQFFTLNRQKAAVFDEVHYWRISNSNHLRVMNFSSNVTFSGTRVGEVLISLSAERIGQLKLPFIFFAASTLAGIVFLFGIMNYKEYLPWWKDLGAKLRSKTPASGKSLSLTDFGDSEISCPFCGNHENFSLTGFKTPDLEKFPILRQYSGTRDTVLLTDIAKIEELSRLKRLIVVQCTGIINKVAGE